MLNTYLVFVLMLFPPACPTPLRSIEEWMKLSLQEVNRYRGKHGIHPLCLSRKLNRSAEDTARWLVEKRGIFEHNLVIGYRDTMKLYDFNIALGNENLAMKSCTGYQMQLPLFLEAIEGWKTSPGHNTTMLSPFYSHIGFGEVISNDATYVISVQHYSLSNTEPCDYEYPSDVSQTLALPSYVAASHRSSISFAYDASGNPLSKPVYDIILKKCSSLFTTVSLESIVRKNWGEMHLLAPDTPGYKKWIELGGRPGSSRPPSLTTSSTAPPITPPSSTSSGLAAAW